jgi:DNA-binding PadR family transcriptional regulator
MSQLKAKTRNLWELTVLCLLRLKPMHPYEMQRLIREWHKDAFLDLKRGSLYHAIERLGRASFIEPVETTREGRRPERTVYRLTDTGENAGIEWLRELLAKPVPEPTQFFAALSFLPHLTPEIVVEQLKERVGFLELEIASLRTVLETMTPRIGRLVLIEVEYLKAMRQADLKWVKSFLGELQAGTLVWNPQQVLAAAAEFEKRSH